MLENKKLDNSKSSVWRTLLKTVLLSPLCLAFPGIDSASNPLRMEDTPNEPDTGTIQEGQSDQTQTEGTEQKPTSTETPVVTLEVPINTPSETATPQPNDVLKNLGLDKFKNVEALGNSYKIIEQMHSKTASENAQLKAQLENFRLESENAKVTQVEQQKQQLEASQVKSAEEIEEENLVIAEELMNNPLAAIEKIRSQIKDQIMKDVAKDVEGLKSQVTPIIEKGKRDEYQSKVNSVAQEFANGVDFAGNRLHPYTEKEEVRTAMAEFLTKFPDLQTSSEGFDMAYKYAIGETNSYGSSQAIDPQTLLSDDAFMKQAALNPKIIELAKNQYLSSIKNGNPPPIMGNAIGNTPAALPENKPKNITEATKSFKKMLGL